MVGRAAAATWVLVGLLLSCSTPAFADRLFAADGGGGNSSTLYILNPATGAVASTVGPIGFAVSGLAYDPGAGILYGSPGNKPRRRLVRTHPTPGAARRIRAR